MFSNRVHKEILRRSTFEVLKSFPPQVATCPTFLVNQMLCNFSAPLPANKWTQLWKKYHKIPFCDYCYLQYNTTPRNPTESEFVYCQVANSNLMKTMNGKETTSTTIINNRPVTIKTFKLEPGMTLQNIPLPPGTLVEPSAKVCTKCPHLDLLDSKSVPPMCSRL